MRILLVALVIVAGLQAQTAFGQDAPPHRPAAPACDRVVFELFQGHYDRALRQLDGAHTAGQSEADLANLRGLALMMSGQAKKAIESFDTALDLQPALAEARLNRGIAGLQSGDYARAAIDFQQIWEDPKSPLRARAAYHAALAADAMHRASEAETWISRALAADPNLDDALLYSAVLADRRGDLQAAGHAYKTYLDRNPRSTVAMLRFGIAASRSGFPGTARRYLQQVIDTAPDSAEAVEARKFLVLWE